MAAATTFEKALIPAGLYAPGATASECIQTRTAELACLSKEKLRRRSSEELADWLAETRDILQAR